MSSYSHCKICDRKFTKDNPFIRTANGCLACKQAMSTYRRENRTGCMVAQTVLKMTKKEKRRRRIRVLRIQRKQRTEERLYLSSCSNNFKKSSASYS